MSKQSDPHDAEMWEVYHKFHYLCDKHRFQKLFARADLVRMIAELPGDIVDAGAFKGISTIEFAHLLETYQPNSRSKVVAFDMFEEDFPHVRDDERAAVDTHRRLFDASAYDELIAALERLELAPRVEIVRGDIVETFARHLADRPGFRISLLHCDLDVYRPTLAVLKEGWPRVVPGGIVVLDEYADGRWGESDAVDEFLAGLDDPPQLRTLPSSPTPTAYFVKQLG